MRNTNGIVQKNVVCMCVIVCMCLYVCDSVYVFVCV